MDFNNATDVGGMFYYCYKFNSFNFDLSKFSNCDSMFRYCKGLTSFTTTNLNNLTSAIGMFAGVPFTSWTMPLPKIQDGTGMFYECTKLKSFDIDLSTLTTAGGVSSILGFNLGNMGMFSRCTALTSFTSNLTNLSVGDFMFYGCTALTSFNTSLPNLTGGAAMFWNCTKLASWNQPLPKLTRGSYQVYGFGFLGLSSEYIGMFYGCTALTSFTGDLSSLTAARAMFAHCYNLTSFNSSLSKITDGTDMFINCKLNAASVKNIINSLPSTSGKTISIGIGSTSANADSFAS